MIHNLNIHGIVSIQIKSNVRKERPMSDDWFLPPYYHRKIIITDRTGHELELDLFGEREGDLELLLDD